MCTRKELKDRAKQILKANYLMVVVVVLILGFVGGISGFSWNGSSTISYKDSGELLTEFSKARTVEDYIKAIQKVRDKRGTSFFDRINSELEDDQSLFNDDFDTESFESEEDMNAGFDDIIGSADSSSGSNYTDLSRIASGLLGIVIIAGFIGIIIGFAVRAFLINPIIVGCKKWVLKNRTEKPDLSEVISVFGAPGYMNVVKVMFLRDLYIFGWTLLLFIPGIIKSYEYRMIPYLLAENEMMSSEEAFGITKNLMTGDKWRAFVLDWSFILWGLLCSIPGIGWLVRIAWVQPYVELTSTEFYVQLCMEKGQASNSSTPTFSDSWT